MSLKDQSQDNAAAADQSAQIPSDCKVCQREGIPVLPLRIAVVPNGMVSSGWQPNIQPQPAPSLKGGEYKYALRTLRMGYLYVLLKPKESNGDKKTWQGYEVTTEGALRQFEATLMPECDAVESLCSACRTQGHCNAGSFINFDTKKYSEAWLAFSSDPWSDDVLSQYEKEPSEERFTHIILDSLQSAPSAEKGEFAIDSALSSLKEKVAEYATLLYPWLEKINEPEGGMHGFYSRQDESTSFGDYVDRITQQYQCPPVAITLTDSVGIIQELKAGQLQLVSAMEDYISQPETMHKHIIALAIENYLAGSEESIKQNSKTRCVYTSSLYPAANSVECIDKDEVGRQTWDEYFTRLQQSYDEKGRADFAKTYKEKVESLQQRIDNVGTDLALWYVAPLWKYVIDNDYSKQQDLLEWYRQFTTVTTCLQGGAIDDSTRDVWCTWFGDTNSPVYKGLLGYSTDDYSSIYSGLSVYSYLKVIVGADEIGNTLKSDRIQAMFNTRILAMNGAFSRGIDKLDDATRHGVIRMLQGAGYVATGQTVTLFSLSMTIREFQQFYQEYGTRLGMEVAKNSSPFSGTIRQGGVTSTRSAVGYLLAITDNELLGQRINMQLSSMVALENLFKPLRKSGVSPSSVTNAPITHQSHVGNFASELRISSLSLLDKTESSLRTVDAAQWENIRSNIISERTGRLVSGNAIGMVLSTAMLAFQTYDLWENNRALQFTDGKFKQLTNYLMIASAATEIAGFGRMLTKKGLWQVLGKDVHTLIKAGGVLAGVASVVDGIRMLFSAWDANKQGDTNSAIFYFFASLSTVAGGVIAGFYAYYGVFTLFGPAGLALALILLGAALAFRGDQLRSSPIEIWLRRCCFGLRREADDIPWQATSLEDLNSALADYNAIISGMRVQVAFSTISSIPGGGGTYRQIESNITLPGYNSELSAYEYQLQAFAADGNALSVTSESHEMFPGQDDKYHNEAEYFFKGYIEHETDEDNSFLIIKNGGWVSSFSYNRAVLTVSYWKNKYNVEDVLSLTLNVKG